MRIGTRNDLGQYPLEGVLQRGGELKLNRVEPCGFYPLAREQGFVSHTPEEHPQSKGRDRQECWST